MSRLENHAMLRDAATDDFNLQYALLEKYGLATIEKVFFGWKTERKSRIDFAWRFLTTPLDLKKEKDKTNQKNALPVKPVAVALALNHVEVP